MTSRSSFSTQKLFYFVKYKKLFRIKQNYVNSPKFFNIRFYELIKIYIFKYFELKFAFKLM